MVSIKNLINNPIISIILIILLFFIIGTPGEYIEEYFSIPGAIIDIILSIFLLFLYSYLFHFDSFFKLENMKIGLILLIPMFIYYIIEFIADPVISFSGFSNINLFISIIGAGIIEEVFFRGILVSHLMKILDSKYKIYIVAILSAGIFALLHFINYNGSNLAITTIQVISAFNFILLAAVYLRTGNLWLTIMIHVLNNFLAFLNPANLGPGGEMVGAVTWVLYLDVVLSIILVIIGLYYIRSSKHKEINDLWDKKWSNS